MGDINLLDRVNRLTKKVAGAVSPTDKASKSAFGIVKVGNNVSVNSGVISVPDATEETKGVVSLGSVGGFKIEQIWQGTTTTTLTSILSELAHTISDYKALLCYAVTKSGDVVTAGEGGTIIPVLTVGDGVSYIFKNLAKEITLTVTTEDVKIRNAGTGGLTGVTICGLK